MRRVLPRGALDVVTKTRVLAAVLAAGALTTAALAGLGQAPEGMTPIFNGSSTSASGSSATALKVPQRVLFRLKAETTESRKQIL